MKVPPEMRVPTQDLARLNTKLYAYVAKFGCKTVEMYLDYIQLNFRKHEGKYAIMYIVSKVCQEYKLTRFELFESSGRNLIIEARQILCVLITKHLKLTQEEISAMFHRTRHFAKRSVAIIKAKVDRNHSLDQVMIGRYKRLDSLIGAYIDFKPISNEP